LRHGVEVFCLGETIAVRLFKRLREACTVTSARRALDRVLRDEVRHREFGWTLLEWMLSTPHAPALRRLLRAELPSMLDRIRRSYDVIATRSPRAPGAPDEASDFSETDRAWGLMPLSEYAAAVEETFARDYVPRFASLNVPIGRR
jgi:hypothetical protein